jgi:hypothetical protein
MSQGPKSFVALCFYGFAVDAGKDDELMMRVFKAQLPPEIM